MIKHLITNGFKDLGNEAIERWCKYHCDMAKNNEVCTLENRNQCGALKLAKYVLDYQLEHSS